eukprot:scaffold6021_cov117-Isochrysis_galbana.AAC.14
MSSTFSSGSSSLSLCIRARTTAMSSAASLSSPTTLGGRCGAARTPAAANACPPARGPAPAATRRDGLGLPTLVLRLGGMAGPALCLRSLLAASERTNANPGADPPPSEPGPDAEPAAAAAAAAAAAPGVADLAHLGEARDERLLNVVLKKLRGLCDKLADVDGGEELGQLDQLARDHPVHVGAQKAWCTGQHLANVYSGQSLLQRRHLACQAQRVERQDAGVALDDPAGVGDAKELGQGAGLGLDRAVIEGEQFGALADDLGEIRGRQTRKSGMKAFVAPVKVTQVEQRRGARDGSDGGLPRAQPIFQAVEARRECGLSTQLKQRRSTEHGVANVDSRKQCVQRAELGTQGLLQIVSQKQRLPQQQHPGGLLAQRVLQHCMTLLQQLVIKKHVPSSGEAIEPRHLCTAGLNTKLLPHAQTAARRDVQHEDEERPRSSHAVGTSARPATFNTPTTYPLRNITHQWSSSSLRQLELHVACRAARRKLAVGVNTAGRA